MINHTLIYTTCTFSIITIPSLALRNINVNYTMTYVEATNFQSYWKVLALNPKIRIKKTKTKNR